MKRVDQIRAARHDYSAAIVALELGEMRAAERRERAARWTRKGN